MIQFGANAFNWIDDWTPEKGNWAIDQACRLGFDILEIPLMRPKEFDPNVHRSVIAKSGLMITASVVLPKDAHMPQHPDRAREFLEAALEKLEAVDGTILCGCIAFSVGVFTGQPPAPAERQVVVDTLGEVAITAKKRGITLGLEVVNRYEGYLYNALVDARETIQAIGMDNVKLHADTYHMNIEEEGFYKPLVACADVLGYVHMSESHRGLMGTGTIHWDEVFRGLADAHFQGPLVLESFSGFSSGLMSALGLWRPPKETPEEMASRGLKFMRQGVARAGMA